jgi:ABC-type Zn uptake system ZnuABC Zn-binding protein ZnuA
MMTACLAGATAAGARPLKVLTSFTPLYSLAANVAGDAATVENLLPANIDPHDYQLGPRDLAKLQAADVLVINGLGLEDWLLRVLKSTRGDRQPVIVELSAGLGTNQLLFDDDTAWARAGGPRGQKHRGNPNPHIWLDPALAQHGLTNICRALQQADPAGAATFAANTAAYAARLQKLDAELKAAAAKFKQRDIATDHNAFPYFARHYGLNVVGVVQEVDEVPPSPRQLARLEEAIRKLGIKVIFASPPVPSRESRQVAADLGIAVATLNTLETGALKASTYEDEMRENFATLEKYLR